jgi:NAD(P)-dependent dehydrogenase (short-subunit alcohol dehydrogenase family)
MTNQNPPNSSSFSNAFNANNPYNHQWLKPTGCCLVTGGSIRIGAAIARYLAQEGWPVAIHYYQHQQEAELLAEDIRTHTGRMAQAFYADLRSTHSTQALFHSIEQELGPPQGMILNASSFTNDHLSSATPESIIDNFNLHVTSSAQLLQLLATHQPQGRRCCAIAIVDYAVDGEPPEHFFSYSLAKASLWQLVRLAAKQLAPNMRVNAIGPGPLLANERQSATQFANTWNYSLLHCSATMTELCHSISLLLHSPSITGQLLRLDGGRHLGHYAFL